MYGQARHGQGNCRTQGKASPSFHFAGVGKVQPLVQRHDEQAGTHGGVQPESGTWSKELLHSQNESGNAFLQAEGGKAEKGNGSLLSAYHYN